MVVKKLWNKFGGEAKTAIYQKKSIEKFEKLAAGEKVAAPKHPTDQKYFDLALRDEKIAEEVKRKNEDLIDKVNKIKINSTEVQQDRSSRPLPSRESEWQYRDTPDYKFGFHEIPSEKMESNTISAREMYELLSIQAKVEKDGRQVDLMAHEGYRRLSPERRENLFKYFGLFVTSEQQSVVDRSEVELLVDYMNNRTGEIDKNRLAIQVKREALARVRKERNKEIDHEKREEEQQRLLEMEKRRDREFERLTQKLKEVEQDTLK
ncbi:unnamed protein product [Bursaphelenchus xylophilus]|uniref:(pine wood nematode) hypothetical protein n=1 Tax=Bursaphelenchus xylophilus TaxID=6326 RepID=A0A1I7S767_BURXY|nr:unnamed protein product [Bursaphelenchus xylophilus]CAG9084675.1 unnamed protein product [Bursaphelenchus xylophilus]